MCIEGFHCLANEEAMLNGVSELLAEGGSLVIADAFLKQDTERVEEKFKQIGWFIQKKEVITHNVRHAM